MGCGLFLFLLSKFCARCCQFESHVCDAWVCLPQSVGVAVRSWRVEWTVRPHITAWLPFG